MNASSFITFFPKTSDDKMLYVSREELFVFVKYLRSQNSPTHLYDLVYFDHQVQFHPSMRSNDTLSDNSGHKS